VAMMVLFALATIIGLGRMGSFIFGVIGTFAFGVILSLRGVGEKQGKRTAGQTPPAPAQSTA
jgi:hypothetical protein